jgi:outer membrane protein OmpA-like peptidoglycan-associated protein
MMVTRTAAVALLVMGLGGCAVMKGGDEAATSPAAGTKIAEIAGEGFEPGKARLTDEGKAQLVDVVRMLQEHPEMRVSVEGHTDSSGGKVYNQSLSERRARMVANEVIEGGVAAARVSIRGYGSSRPVANNATVQGRARNRRVEIVVVQ